MSDPTLGGTIEGSTAADTSAVTGIERSAKLTGLDGAADYADAANDLAQKKGKLAHAAHENTHSSDSDFTPEEQRKYQNRPRSALSKALGASGDKIINGALMFAGFSILLAGSMSGVGSLLQGVAGEAFINDSIGKLVTTVIAAATTGAAWLGGNEFWKVYKAESAKEDSRLNRTIEKAKERLHLKGKEAAPEVAPQRQPTEELAIVAGSLSSHVGAAGYLSGAANLAAELPSRTNQTVQAILEKGPSSPASALQLAGERAQSNAQRLEQRAEMLADQAAQI